MEEYRFHMRLTDLLAEEERRSVMTCLKDYAKAVCRRKPWNFGALTLMRQKGPNEPFHTLKRYPIRASATQSRSFLRAHW